jgi:hypothetical protein
MRRPIVRKAIGNRNRAYKNVLVLGLGVGFFSRHITDSLAIFFFLGYSNQIAEPKALKSPTARHNQYKPLCLPDSSAEGQVPATWVLPWPHWMHDGIAWL